jgi:hypothetical protein
MPGPDFSPSSTIDSVLTFIPGVLLGFIGFLVFGTTCYFRKIYAESIRHYCYCCGCVGGAERRKKRDGSSLSPSFADRDVEGGRSWQAMGNGRGRVPTYHCRIESVAPGDVELSNFGQGMGSKKGPMVRTVEDPARAKQPWKTLGIDPPEGREH